MLRLKGVSVPGMSPLDMTEIYIREYIYHRLNSLPLGVCKLDEELKAIYGDLYNKYLSDYSDSPQKIKDHIINCIKRDKDIQSILNKHGFNLDAPTIKGICH
ncbi:MAG: hypothetical protein VSS52_001660 [Thiotrichaceae bacterium]|nr:hypothetical protein [Thiotrichaceae bacterium]